MVRAAVPPIGPVDERMNPLPKSVRFLMDTGPAKKKCTKKKSTPKKRDGDGSSQFWATKLSRR
jgi:hypothetical protein